MSFLFTTCYFIGTILIVIFFLYGERVILIKKLSKRSVLGALRDNASGQWIINLKVISQKDKFDTPFGILEFISLKGWCIRNFTGSEKLPPEDICPLWKLLKAHNKDYTFTSKPIDLYLSGKTNHWIFNVLGHVK